MIELSKVKEYKFFLRQKKIFDADHKIFFGDLNFRIDTTIEEAVEKIEEIKSEEDVIIIFKTRSLN